MIVSASAPAVACHFNSSSSHSIPPGSSGLSVSCFAPSSPSRRATLTRTRWRKARVPLLQHGTWGRARRSSFSCAIATSARAHGSAPGRMATAAPSSALGRQWRGDVERTQASRCHPHFGRCSAFTCSIRSCCCTPRRAHSRPLALPILRSEGALTHTLRGAPLVQPAVVSIHLPMQHRGMAKPSPGLSDQGLLAQGLPGERLLDGFCSLGAGGLCRKAVRRQHVGGRCEAGEIQ